MEYGRTPRHYDFNVNGYGFKIIILPWNDEGVHPKDILAHDLEQCIVELKSAEIRKPFTLPPLNPNDSGKSKNI